MADYYEDNEDLRFYVERGLDWEPLVRLTEYEFKSPGGFANTAEAVEFYRETLRLVGKFAADEIGAHARELDKAHPRLVNGEVAYPEPLASLWGRVDDLELSGLCVPRELGGMNAPMLVFQMHNELFARADVSVCAHAGFHGGMAMAALVYSILEGTSKFDPALPGIAETRFKDVIDSILTGREWGSMDITEPHAGSDMGALRCKAEQDADGSWFLTGPKIFITSGHGRWHFVIARTEDARGDDLQAGLAGLSMFVVEAFTRDEAGQVVRTHTRLDAVETKLGHNGSATVAISFERAPARLVGQRGEGFKYMLMLMNNARIGVGFEALGLSEAAYRLAAKYAEDRVSMGKPIARHELIADQLDEMRTDILAIRCLAMTAGWHEEMAQKLAIQLRFRPPESTSEQEALAKTQKEYQRYSRRLTPLLKFLAAEKAVDHARRAVQIHGGSGYMVEYGVEKLLRDAMVMPIYEGTTQIQALMAMKDTLLGAVKHPRRFVRATAQARWAAVSARDPMERRVAKLRTYEHQAVQFLLSRLAGTKLKELRNTPVGDWSSSLKHFDPKRDFALALLHAERLARILTDVAIAECLHEQAKKHPDRMPILERWLERAEPRCRHLLDEITTTGSRLLRELHREPAADLAQAAK